MAGGIIATQKRLDGAHSLRIESISEWNTSLDVDEAGDHDDFVVIRNLSRYANDIGGMYLRDSIRSPMRWKIPNRQRIADGRTLRIWLDGEPSEGALHANFKLNKQEDSLVLTNFNERQVAIIDFVVYGAFQPDQTLTLSREVPK